jgi:glycosyltransferase involved in cell wall biosynthesis
MSKNKMNNPKISVIIPLYNHEKYIKEAVYSVLEQTVSEFELIIINDGSTDRSEAIVRSIPDKRIRYYYQENQGAHNTINKGIKLAKGEYISILNSDDVYKNNRLEMCLKILDNNSSFSAVFSHIEFIDDQGKFIKYHGAQDNWINHDSETSFKDEDNIILNLLAGNFLTTTSNLFCRKSVFQDIGLFQNLKYAHDYEFFLRLCYHFKVHIIDMPFLKYRIHPDNKIKENEAETDFEVGLVISNFFLNYDLKEFFSENNIYTTMVKFLNSINTYNSERMIMTLVLFGIKYKIHSQFFKALTENPENPFRKVCIDHFKTYLDVWQESQEAWSKWSETNERLIESDKKLSEAADEVKKWWLNSQEAWSKWSETNERLIESEKKLSEANERLIESEKKLSEANERLIESEKK